MHQTHSQSLLRSLGGYLWRIQMKMRACGVLQ